MKTRRLWVSRADLRALFEAARLQEELERKAPGRGLRALPAALASKSFRRRTADLGDDAAEEHVLLDVPLDVFAALRAMGRCGTADAAGRPVCTAASTAMQLYRVLLEQFAILFHVQFEHPNDWSPEQTTRKGQGAFLVDEPAVQKALDRLGSATDVLCQSKRFLTSRSRAARHFVAAEGALEKALADAVGRRLQFEKIPSNLDQFRQFSSCPEPVKQGHVHKSPSVVCMRVVLQHMQLFAARLAESVVMDALARVPEGLRTDTVEKILNAEKAMRPSNSAWFNLSKFRLAWREDEQHHWSLDGALDKFGSQAPAGGRAHLGLSSETRWPGPGRGLIQDDLTATTRELSRLSDAHASEANVLTSEFLRLSPGQSNPVFDRSYAEKRQKYGRAPMKNVCEGNPSSREQKAMLLSLRNAKLSRATTWGELNLRETPELADRVKAVQDSLETFRNTRKTGTQGFRSQIWLSDKDGKLNFELTITKKNQGLHDFVLWMLCHGRTLAGMTFVNGHFSENGRVVAGSTVSLQI